METTKKYCRKCKKVFNTKKFMATIICEDCDPFMKEHPYNLYQKGLEYDKLKKQRDELLATINEMLSVYMDIRKHIKNCEND